MYPVLILREEIVCLVILLFLTLISRKYRMGTDSHLFNRLLIFAIIHVIMDIVTVWTVNHQEAVPRLLNDFFHVIFYISAMCFAAQIFVYVIDLFLHRDIRKWQHVTGGLIIAYAVLLPLCMQIDYRPVGGEAGTAAYRGTYSSQGTAAVVGYAITFLYFIGAISIILRFRKQLGNHLKYSLLPMLGILILAETAQILFNELLFTGGAVTIVTVGFFFSLENPSYVLERKVAIDAMSGFKTRTDYEREIALYDEEFKKQRDDSFILLLSGISNLKAINGLQGHMEGTECISEVAVMLMNNLRYADSIYRMGGDEFLAVYRKRDEKTMLRDLKRTREALAREYEGKPYQPELVSGYAVSNADYRSLRELLRVADYMMYRNKAEMKRAAADAMKVPGTQMNLTGLTDRVFDAMCLTSEEYYPYIANMETHVTRMAPSLMEFLGLESEFVTHFSQLWLERVHPDDRKELEEDLTAAMQGRKQYHYCKYRVRNRHGEYVTVTCRGGLYHGRDGEPDIFAGYMVNHGQPETMDPATGLQNSYVLSDRLNDILQTGRSAALIRLEIQNMTRVRMLYGSEVAATLTRSLADMMHRTVHEHQDGSVFSRNGDNFTILLPDKNRTRAQEIFGRIRESCESGVMVGDNMIPVGITGGAVILPCPKISDAETARLAAIYAAEETRYSPLNRLVFYRDIQTEQGEKDMTLLKAIHHDCVTARKHFYLRYQPIVDLQSGKLTGAEALLRWRSPELGEIPPGRFISFLETDPGYAALGFDILRTAIKEAKRIGEKVPGFRVNVNITALQLFSEEFLPRVLDILRELAYPAERLVLELTERCKEMEFESLKERVAEIREKGIRVALDDMGTGFSTIDLLLHLRVDVFKLDMMFTRGMRENKKETLYAQTICKAAEDGQISVCFEGIETEEMAEYLKQYGKVSGQGYYFDKPLLAEEFEEKYD